MHTADLEPKYQTSTLLQIGESTADPPKFPIERRLRVRCGHCDLTQWEAKTCRRCHYPLPLPIIEFVEVEKPVPVITKELVEVPVIREVLVPHEQPCLKCAGLSSVTRRPVEVSDHLPLLAEMERTLIQAAIERSGGDRQKAANMLGIGKTTIYRKLKEYRIALNAA
jgi:hypothetical protein